MHLAAIAAIAPPEIPVAGALESDDAISTPLATNVDKTGSTHTLEVVSQQA